MGEPKSLVCLNTTPRPPLASKWTLRHLSWLLGLQWILCDDHWARHRAPFLRRGGRAPVGKGLEWGHKQLPRRRDISQGCGQARSVPLISMPSICSTQAQTHKPSPREPTSGLRGHLKAQDRALSSQGTAARNQLHSPHSSLFVPQQLKVVSHVRSIQSLSHSRYNNDNNNA